MRDLPPSDSLRDPDPADPPPAAAAAEPPSSAGPPPAVEPAAGQLQPVLARLAAFLERALGAEAPTAAAAVASAAADFAAWRPPPLSDAVLQELRFSAPRSGPGLAYRVLDGQVRALETGVLLLGGARVSFNTYLNSFYEHYWLTHAPVEDLALRLFGSGEVMVEAFRAMPDGSAYRIGHHRLRLDPEGSAAAKVALDLGPTGAGRIFFNVTAIPAGAAILAGRLETGTPPARAVRLGIGLCTFNRERMLLATLQRVLRSPYHRWAAPRIVVVNQGPRFASAEMTALLAREAGRVELVEQPNLGGAGGFTRAAMEILRGGGGCSHVLFMDDDIDFDPEVLVTTHAFAARAARPTVVGGAMVDLFRPNVMYEAGAVIDARNIIRALLHNRQLDRSGALDDLAREVPCHFNGWWYCAIPVGMFREHGLPLPIFIRGDDMEYGARLASRGVPTVSLPPVAVWHEPFYAKPPGWQLYYDLRNRLIFAACHPSLVRLDPPGVVLRRLVDSLLKHDYMHAELVIRAVEDFLSGPQALDTPMDTLHRDVSALAAAHAPQRPASAVGMPPATAWRPPPRNGAWRRLSLLGGMAALALGLVRPKLRPDLLFVDQWHPWATMRSAQYGLSDRMHSYVQVYRYDRHRLRRGLRRGLAAVWRYRRERRGAVERWRAAHPELSSWARWERILGLEPAAAASDAAGTEGRGARAPDHEPVA